MAANDIVSELSSTLTPALFLSVYKLKFPWERNSLPKDFRGSYHFRPDKEYKKAFYDLIFHPALLPLSKFPLNALLAIDFTIFLPPTTSPDYPEQALGLVTLIDQARMFFSGYNRRYMRSFFDPLAEKLSRQFIALPDDQRPDSKNAWLSRGYTAEDWLVRVMWFWVPLVHADDFMVKDRASLKAWLHEMRAEVESFAARKDPFAKLEAADDVDLNAFQTVETEGPPEKSYEDKEKGADLADYTFWWIRILNAHFAITDYCGYYPYWIRWKGADWTDRDRHFFKVTDNYRYSPADDEPAYEQVKKDAEEGVWKDLAVEKLWEST